MSKTQKALEIVKKEFDSFSGDKTDLKAVKKKLNNVCVDLIKSQCQMTDGGATTYFQNAWREITTGTKPYQPKIKEAIETVPKVPFVGTGVDPSTRGMYSVVRMVNDKAIHVSAHHSQHDAVMEGRAKQLPVVNGLQVIGQKLGTIERGTKC